MLGGTKPEIVVTAGRLMNLMLEAKLLRAAVPIEELLAPGPLSQLRQ
jgi:hypothetical protein